MGCCASFYYNNKSCGLEDTIKKMKQSEVILEKRQEDLEIKIEETKVSALMSAQTDRIAARKSLRKHKRHVKQLQLIDSQLSTLEMNVCYSFHITHYQISFNTTQQILDYF